MLKPPREETGFGKVAESDQQEQWERRSKTWVFEDGEKHITHGYPSFCVVLVGAPDHAPPRSFPAFAAHLPLSASYGSYARFQIGLSLQAWGNRPMLPLSHSAGTPSTSSKVTGLNIHPGWGWSSVIQPLRGV